MPTKKKQIKILLVEDDKSLAEMYQIKFSREEFSTIHLSDGIKVIETVKSENPDIILLDIIVPGIDGFANLTTLKKDARTKNVPVVMLTNLGQDEDKEKGKKLGAEDYWVKADLTPAQVVDKIKKILKIN